MRWFSELKTRLLNWATDDRSPGLELKSTVEKHLPEELPPAVSTFTKRLPEKLPPAVKAGVLNRDWLSTPLRKTGAISAGATLALGSVVVGTAQAAQPADVEHAVVVSELDPTLEGEGEGNPDAQGAVDGGEPPAEGGEEAAPVEEAAPAEEPPAEEPAPEPVVEETGPVVPVDDVRVTGPYGWRTNVNPLMPAGSSELHNGMDFGANTGTPVKSVLPGTVTYAEYHQYGGLRIVVDHGDGTETTYNHLNEILVDVGQVVGADEVIGTVGSTGNSTGPHLHFEMMRNGEYVDPAPLLGL